MGRSDNIGYALHVLGRSLDRVDKGTTGKGMDKGTTSKADSVVIGHVR